MAADIKALAAKYNDYIVERRRYYHAHPELTEHEAKTTESIVNDLEAMGSLSSASTACTAASRR